VTPPAPDDPPAIPGRPLDPGGLVNPDAAVPSRDAHGELSVLVAIALGGVIGAEARYGVGRLLPHTSHEFPLSTLVINTTGCLLIGLLMAVLLERTPVHRLARPFLGVGILGGYTTFSSFAVDADNLLRADRIVVALSYVLSTLVLGWLAVRIGLGAVRTFAPDRR
jgi:CrcB protein